MPTPKRHDNRANKQRAYRLRQALTRRNEQEAKGMPPLPAVATIPGERRWQALLQLAHTALETVRDEMLTYHTDRSDTWQESDKGEAFQERIQSIDELLDSIQDVQQ